MIALTQGQMRQIAKDVILAAAAGNEIEAMEMAGQLPDYAQDQLLEMIEAHMAK